jgi:hypothetical protein
MINMLVKRLFIHIVWMAMCLSTVSATTLVLPEALHLKDADSSPFELRMVACVAPFYLYDASMEYKTRFWDDQFHRYYDSDEGPNYVNEKRFADALPRFERYCKIMSQLGCNATMLGDLIHLVNFDQLVEGQPHAIYGPDSPYRKRHDFYRAYFKQLIKIAAKYGMDFYVYTDEFTHTPPLQKWVGKLSVDNDKLWKAYQAKYDELFTTFPELAGVILRFGEIYPTRGYAGKDIVNSRGHDPERFRKLITKTWEVVCKKHGKTYIHRTWSIGLNSITGQADIYSRIWDGLPTEGIIVSVKHIQTDFWYYNPPNPTMGLGKHKQMMEVQTRREYYGMGIYPNMPYAEFARDFKLAKRKENVMGYWIWPNEGGGNNGVALGPQSHFTYLSGFTAWNEANTYLAAALGVNPSADVDAILNLWASTIYGESAAGNIVRILKLSNRTVESGHNISDYAKNHVWWPHPHMRWFDLRLRGFAPYQQLQEMGSIRRMAAEAEEAVQLSGRQLALYKEIDSTVADRILARDTLDSLMHQEALYTLTSDWRRAILFYNQAYLRGGAEVFNSAALTGDVEWLVSEYMRTRDDLTRSLAHYDKTYHLYRTRYIHRTLEKMSTLASPKDIKE